MSRAPGRATPARSLLTFLVEIARMGWQRVATGAALGASLLTWSPAVPGDAGSAWTVTARYERGRPGEAVEGDGTPFWYGLALRWDYGTRFPLYAELPLLHVENAGGVLLTGAGPVGGPQAGRGPGQGAGPGGGSGGGPGGRVARATVEAASGDVATDWTGVGDLRAGVAFPILDGAARRQWLEALAEVKAPTGPGDCPVCSGAWDGRLGAAWGYRFFSADIALDAGWNFVGDAPEVELHGAPDAAVTVSWESARPAWLWSAWIAGRGEIAAGSGPGSAVGIEIGATGGVPWSARASAGIGSGAGYEFALAVALEFGGAGRRPDRWRKTR